MFGFIKKVLVVAMTFVNFNLSKQSFLECFLMNNQVCKIRSEIINVNTSEPICYPYSIKISK